MSQQGLNPLTRQQIDDLKKAKLDAEQALAQVELAKKAKIDVGSQETELKQQLEQIDAMLSVYGSLPASDE